MIGITASAVVAIGTPAAALSLKTDPAVLAFARYMQVEGECPGDSMGDAAEAAWLQRWEAAKDAMIASEATTTAGLFAKLKFAKERYAQPDQDIVIDQVIAALANVA